MPADIITAVEDDLLAALTAAAAGAKVRVESLPGDWDDDMLKRLLPLAPCVLVAFSGGVPARIGELEPTIDSQWAVYAVTSHPSGQAARRRGNAQALGAYELISRLVVPALHGRDVPDAGVAHLVRVDNLFTGSVERQGLAVYAATFRVPMPFSVLPDPEGLDDFATFVAQLDVPPHATGAQHVQWLASNYSSSTPDARDQVSLPTAP